MLILLIFFLMPMTQAATLTVLAASSTTDAMDEAAELFTKWTGHTVRFSFGSSGALARQIQSGAPADLFLSANQKWMDALAAGGLMDESSRVDLLRNRLVLIVPTAGTLWMSPVASRPETSTAFRREFMPKRRWSTPDSLRHFTRVW
ncbi:MAG TPA: molybdate ABC transporter substrate-binding protein [Tichowtungia sp.]|nr:molybdate ABC transporter substrate-binding protein [Tichowtungia sp.]